jgi:enoyl-CoA hydratase
MTELIQIDLVREYVAVVTLNRPPVNAMGREIREQFVDAMDRLGERDDVRVIILTSGCKVFSAGADIKEKRHLVAAPGGYAKANRLTRDSFLALKEGPKPVIAAVNGPALGAGFVMVACCDIVLASEDTWFQMPEIDVGLGGGASFLQNLIPQGKMRRMMLTGEKIPAAELYRLGAVEECLPADQLMPRAIAIASLIAEKSPVAVKAIRSHFDTVGHLGLYEGFKVEQRYVTDLSKTPDAAEARLAFIEKRKPRFE